MPFNKYMDYGFIMGYMCLHIVDVVSFLSFQYHTNIRFWQDGKDGDAMSERSRISEWKGKIT